MNQRGRVSYLHPSLPPLPIQVCAKFGVGTCSVYGGGGLQVWERREEEGGGESAGARDLRNLKNNKHIAPHGQKSAQRRGMMRRTRCCDVESVWPAVKENEGAKGRLSCKNFWQYLCNTGSARAGSRE
jgi:hypothetical protein